VLSRRFKPWHVPLFAAKYLRLRRRRRPLVVHFEVTRRCNAGCDFCDYWKTPARARVEEIERFAEAARFFDPLMITFTGGEPLLRRDLESLVEGVAAAVRLKYIAVITHGAMLTPERALSLWRAGINQFNISLDFPDERHDRARKLPGLTERIFHVIPRLQALGIDSIRFNTVIKNDNLEALMPLVRRADELGVGVAFSVYTERKNGNDAHTIPDDRLAILDAAVADLIAYKHARRGVIVSSDHYLRAVPRWVRGELAGPCFAGERTIHIDPAGLVRRCPDFPPDGHWTTYQGYRPIQCDDCFYACRGEAQAPLTLSRVRDVMA
jgi:MoaA/NifB/PqqE/SkfB family radical SAM enzyme